MSNEEEFNYDRDLEINKNDLRRECSSQPKLLMKYVKEVARQSKEVKFTKETLAKVRSRLTTKLIKSRDKKPLVSEIEAYIIEHEDYQTTVQNLINLEYEYDILKGTITAFHHRKDMIQETIRLMNMNYFSAVEIPLAADESGVGEKMKERASTGTREKINKKRRNNRRSK